MKKFLLYILIFVLMIFSGCCKNHDDIKIEESHKEEKIVSTWINYNEIHDLIKDIKNDDVFERKVSDIVMKLKEYGINTIFLQVRAFDDSFYVSEISPRSFYSKNEYKQFDVLDAFINVCHTNDVYVHAWINPYRISNSGDIKSIQNGTYAYKIIQSDYDDERIIKTNDTLYYNPSYSDIQKYILSCVKEILLKYDVDGIHIDDYFYPTTQSQIDKLIYSDYLASGGDLSLGDFRRYNVNTLVNSLYLTVKNYNENLVFSISPCADVEKNYNNLYADINYWVTEGFADYIIPQLYYGYDNEKMPFESLLKKWSEMCTEKCKIIPGLSLYKCGKEDVYAGKGKNEWIEKPDIISQQIISSINNGANGIAFYSASYLYNDTEKLYHNNIKSIVNNWNDSET